ncbi:enhanced serine sensitivity protein SseB C-terminal domain-containing protein [Nocardia heshunensis]
MPHPGNQLEASLAAAKDGRLSNSELLQRLRDSSLYVPVSPDGSAAGAQGLLGVTIEGAQFVPAYSSEEQLVLAAGEVPRIALAVTRLVQLIPAGVGIALNWRAPAPGLPITSSGIDALRGGSMTVAANSEVRLGQPVRRPDEFLERLSQELRHIGELQTARFGLMQIGADQPAFLIGIELSDSSPAIKQHTAALVQQVASQFPLEYRVDVYFSIDGEDEFDRQVVALPRIAP